MAKSMQLVRTPTATILFIVFVLLLQTLTNKNLKAIMVAFEMTRQMTSDGHHQASTTPSLMAAVEMAQQYNRQQMTADNQHRNQTTLPRPIITLYEDFVMNKSQDFTIIPYAWPLPPEDEAPVHYTPKVSIRDCNRPELMKKNDMQWILWGHQKEILSKELQREHCLSALLLEDNGRDGDDNEDNYNPDKKAVPMRHVPEVQPLFVTYAQNATITANGVVKTKNENLYFKRSCHAEGKVKASLADASITKCEIQLDNVFVASQYWGTETGHFTGETLPRIVPYLDLARQMPIHMWGIEKLSSQVKTWFAYLNLTAVQGDNVCAKHVYVASPSDCRAGAYMSNMILQTRHILNPPNDPDDEPVQPKRILIMHRDVGGHSSREPIRDITGLIDRMRQAGYDNIWVAKSSNSTFWNCIPCQMEMYRNTWLFISSHGAGSMNLQFMPIGTYVVEIASSARKEEPYYSNIGQRAYLLGQRYYHYYWNKPSESTQLDIDFFISELQDFAPPPLRVA